MKLKNSTIQELGEILKSEFNLNLPKKDLEKLAYTLVGYFSLLIKIENEHKFQNRSPIPIDQSTHKDLDEKEDM